MSIDDLLRDALRDDSYALPGWPDATARVRAGISRRRRHRAATAAAALAAVTALAVPIVVSQLAAGPSLQGPGVTVTPSPGQVIPWLERRVGPVTSAGPQSRTLVAFIDAASTVDPGANLDYVVSLENRSDTDLRLDPSDSGLYVRYVELCRQARVDPPPLEWVREQVSRWNAMLRVCQAAALASRRTHG